MNIFFQALYFMLPAYLANMMPVFLKKVPLFDYPLDHGLRWRGKQIFGSHKTYRGLISGALTGIITALLQKYLHRFLPSLPLLPYDDFSYPKMALIGLALGGGILLGDLAKSFFKRRLNITDGGRFFPFDQLDFLGALFFVSIFFVPPIPHLIVIFIASPLLSIIIDLIGYRLGLRDVWW